MVEVEQLRVRPDIRAVVRDKNRNVADHRNLAGVAIVHEALPVIEEKELEELDVLHRGLELPASRGQGMRVAAGEFGLPRRPRPELVGVLQREEQGEIIEPESVLAAEGGESFLLRLRCAALEHPADTVKHLRALNDDRAEIDRPVVEFRKSLQPRTGKQSVLGEEIEADQERIAGKRRKALVRRIRIAGRPDGQYLPEMLACCMKEIGELVGFGSEFTDAVRTGQGRGMQQDAGLSWKLHVNDSR